MAGPIFGTGIAPAAGSAYATELTAVTRRAYVPKMFVQLYNAAPSLQMALRNAQRAQGGISPVTVPIQGSSYVNFNWTGVGGGFAQPTVNNATNTASWNMSLGVVPIPILGTESLMQSTEAVIPLLRARLADATTVAKQSIATAFFGTQTTDPTSQQINGLMDAYDDGTNVATYGGIGRTANPFWKSTLVTASVTPSRQTMVKQIMSITSKAGGEAPDLVIMSMSDWTTLMTDFMNSETFFTKPDSRYGRDDAVNAGFSAIMLNNTPIVCDPFCPKGKAFLINTRYLALYIAEAANFAFSGFYSLIPNGQMGNLGVLAIGMALACTKPISGGQLSTVAGGAF